MDNLITGISGIDALGISTAKTSKNNKVDMFELLEPS